MSQVDPQEALEMLSEIGTENLKRDYTFTILNNLLASRDELDKLLAAVGNDKITLLKKLHCIQALICMCQTFMSPSQTCLRNIVQQAIKDLVGKPLTSDQQCVNFTLNVTGDQVKDQINVLCPSVWQCHLSSSCDPNVDLQTMCYLSVDPPIDNIENSGN